MPPILQVLMLTLAAGAAIPLGGVLAKVERLRPAWLESEFRDGVMAFGGGVLIAAVALVLIPEGVRALSPWAAIASVIMGGVVFGSIDHWLATRGTPAAMLLATMLDFIPEALALGAAFTAKPALALLLALLIALQNLPEGFNAYREMRQQGAMAVSKVMGILLATAATGPVAGAIGYYAMADAPVATGVIMVSAAGGILYLTFQDIAPQAKSDHHWAPSLGAVLGFAVGLLGHLLTQR